MNLVGPQVTQLSQALEALGLSRRLFPCRHYAGHAHGQSRYFPRKLPLALEEDRATFVYVDPSRHTDSELCSWGAEHARLWAALHAQDHPVHVVAVARDDLRRERATAPILQCRIRIDRGRTWLSVRIPAETGGRVVDRLRGRARPVPGGPCRRRGSTGCEEHGKSH
ncbi:MAG: hypothetical protein OXT71_10530 [Acidobacteriota bacterium]|nr:hypothetical protein [Acidobacteriota bacterium]